MSPNRRALCWWRRALLLIDAIHESTACAAAPSCLAASICCKDIIRQADEVNGVPLPPIPDEFGVRLPPLEFQTTLPNLQWDAEAEALPDEGTGASTVRRPAQTTKGRPDSSVLAALFFRCFFFLVQRTQCPHASVICYIPTGIAVELQRVYRSTRQGHLFLFGVRCCLIIASFRMIVITSTVVYEV